MTRVLLFLAATFAMTLAYMIIAAATERLVDWAQGHTFVQPRFAGNWWPIFLPLTLLVITIAVVWGLFSWIRRWGRV